MFWSGARAHRSRRSGALGAALCLRTVAARTFTVTNNCPFTIWPAIYTDLSAGTAIPNWPTGWIADAFTSVSFSVPDNWTSGRIWGRRDCDFDTTTSTNTCISGGCNGGLFCDQHTGTGIPPTTLAEWTLSASSGLDYYDVSLVSGYNLPLAITPSVPAGSACPAPACAVDLGPPCPPALAGPFDTIGFPLGCKAACEVDPDPQNSPNCCSGQFNTAATCPNSGVQDYWFFKGNCPNAYAYAYDESSGTALWTCSSSLAANYTLTFCPSNSTLAASSVSATGPGGAASTPPPDSGNTGGSSSSSSSSTTSSLVPSVSVHSDSAAAGKGGPGGAWWLALVAGAAAAAAAGAIGGVYCGG